MSDRPLPNFMIVGSPKCGTTSLHDYLAQHPDIFMTKQKELHFFDQGPRGRPALDSYLEHFVPGAHHRYRGESTPMYLSTPTFAQELKELFGHPKMVVVLRDPVIRSHSHFWFRVSQGRMEWEKNFSTFIRSEYGEKSILRIGRYHEHLSRLLEYHPRENVLVLLQDELLRDGVVVCQEVFRFLGLDDSFCPDLSDVKNVTRVPKNEKIAFLAHRSAVVGNNIMKRLSSNGLLGRAFRSLKVKVRDAVYTKAPKLSAEDETYLRAYYAEDVTRLEGLLGRDLTAWKVGERKEKA